MIARPIPRSSNLSSRAHNRRRPGSASRLGAYIAALLCALSAHAHADEASTTNATRANATADPSTSPSPASALSDDATLEEQLAEAKSVPEFNRVRTPSSSAFTILGISPTQIQGPGTPRDFALVVANNLQSGSDLTVPKNLALEIAPYWWFDHDRLTFDEMVNASPGSSLLRNLSLSFGSSSRDYETFDSMGMSTGTATESKLAIGMRTQLLTGNSQADICGGRVQEKAMALARSLLDQTSPDLKAASDTLFVARVSQTVWESLIDIFEKRAKADGRIADATAILADQNASLDAKQAANTALIKAKADKQAALDELQRLSTLTNVRANRLRDQVADADKAAREQTDPDKQQAAEAKLAKLKDRLNRADTALTVLNQGKSLSLDAARLKLAQAKTDEQKALAAQVQASEQNKQAALMTTYSSKLQELIDLCKDASSARVGLTVSIAAASAWVFPDSTFDDGDFDQIAGWLTVAHTWKQGTTLAGLVRVAYARKDEDARSTLIDSGARVIYAQSRYAASMEAVARTFTDDFVGVRAVVSGDYMVSKGKWLSVSIGKDFSDDGPIFSLANLTWGVGGESTIGP